MKFYFLLIFLTIITFGCKEIKNAQENEVMIKDTISNDCKAGINYVKHGLHLENFSKSHIIIVESDSHLMKSSSIRQILLDYNVRFPLNKQRIFIYGEEVIDNFSYIDYMNLDEFYAFYFKLNFKENQEFDALKWIENNYSAKQKTQIINKCLNAKEYCVLIVKVLWKPYLEELVKQGNTRGYNYEKSIYDSLLIEWKNKDSLKN